MKPSPRVKLKWRPALALIVSVVLLAVMALPVLLLVWFRAVELGSSPMTTTELCALIAVLLLTLLVAYVLSRTITAPIHGLIARADAISRGGRGAIRPLDSYGTREIALLTQSFLDLAGKLVDHSDYVRSFAAHVSHELKSPLTSIKGAAELLRDDAQDGVMSTSQQQQFLDNIICDADRLNGLLLRLRELAQTELAAPQGHTSLNEITSHLRTRLPALDIAASGDTAVSMALSSEAAGVIFTNMADNAAQHGATTLTLTARRDGATLRITLQDNGHGIAAANRERIFQPFFSTRRESGGTGMGLDIVRAMLGAHGGTVHLIDSHGPGAAFDIAVPLAGSNR